MGPAQTFSLSLPIGSGAAAELAADTTLPPRLSRHVHGRLEAEAHAAAEAEHGGVHFLSGGSASLPDNPRLASPFPSLRDGAPGGSSKAVPRHVRV